MSGNPLGRVTTLCRLRDNSAETGHFRGLPPYGEEVLLALALLSAWIAPVPSHVTRSFDLGADPFEGGRHRGADFAAQPGTPVRAACGGRVAIAGRVGTSGRLVTIRCGPYRVTALPLRALAVHPGEAVREGERIGTAARSPEHAGIHLGVRRASDRFGYVDPLRLLGRPHTHAPPAGPLPPAQPRMRDGRPPPAPEPAARPAPATDGAGSSPVAPWPVWAGLGLALVGAVGTAAVRVPRSRRSALARASPEQVR
jgi:murein DD-endopeptidase MepM/ murein hydrolase activator NlpD